MVKTPTMLISKSWSWNVENLNQSGNSNRHCAKAKTFLPKSLDGTHSMYLNNTKKHLTWSELAYQRPFLSHNFTWDCGASGPEAPQTWVASAAAHAVSSHAALDAEPSHLNSTRSGRFARSGAKAPPLRKPPSARFVQVRGSANIGFRLSSIIWDCHFFSLIYKWCIVSCVVSRVCLLVALSGSSQNVQKAKSTMYLRMHPGHVSLHN